MPRIGNPKLSKDSLCERCNSKRRVSKTWTEKIKNPNGFMTLYHTQIVCTNKECQSAFEKTILADIEKREKLKMAKLEDAAKRLATKTA
jgi:hypothetical protein